MPSSYLDTSWFLDELKIFENNLTRIYPWITINYNENGDDIDLSLKSWKPIVNINKNKLDVNKISKYSSQIIWKIELIKLIANLKNSWDTADLDIYEKYSNTSNAYSMFYRFLFQIITINNQNIPPMYSSDLKLSLESTVINIKKTYKVLPKHLQFLLWIYWISVDDDEVNDAINELKSAWIISKITDPRVDSRIKLKIINEELLPNFVYFLKSDKKKWKPTKVKKEEKPEKTDENDSKKPEEVSNKKEDEYVENPSDFEDEEWEEDKWEEQEWDWEEWNWNWDWDWQWWDSSENDWQSPDYNRQYDTPEWWKFEKNNKQNNWYKIEISPPMKGYFTVDNKSHFNPNTKKWNNISNISKFDSANVKFSWKKHTLSAKISWWSLKSIPLPRGYVLDLNSLAYTWDKPEFFRDDNWAFFLWVNWSVDFSIDFYEEEDAIETNPIKEDLEKLYNWNLTTNAQEAISKALSETDFNKKVRIILDYITSNHFYPPGKDSSETMNNAKKLQASIAKRSKDWSEYIKNLDASKHLECYSANTLFIAMLREIWVNARLATWHHLQWEINKNWNAEINSWNWHAWSLVWDWKNWIWFDATPSKDSSDPRNKKDPNDKDDENSSEKKNWDSDEANDWVEKNESWDPWNDWQDWWEWQKQSWWDSSDKKWDSKSNWQWEKSEKWWDSSWQSNDWWWGEQSWENENWWWQESKDKWENWDWNEWNPTWEPEQANDWVEKKWNWTSWEWEETWNEEGEWWQTEEDIERELENIYKDFENEVSKKPDTKEVDDYIEEIKRKAINAIQKDRDEQELQRKYPWLTEEQIKRLAKFVKDFRKELDKISRIKNPLFKKWESDNETLEQELRSIFDRIISRSLKDFEIPRFPVDDWDNLILIDPVQLYIDTEEWRDVSYSYMEQETRQTDEMKIVKVRKRKVLDWSGSMNEEWWKKLRIQQQIEVLENKVTAEKQRELNELSDRLDRDVRLETETWQFWVINPQTWLYFSRLKELSPDFEELEQASIWTLSWQAEHSTNDFDPLETIYKLLQQENLDVEEWQPTTFERIRAWYLVRQIKASDDLEKDEENLGTEDKKYLENLRTTETRKVFLNLIKIIPYKNLGNDELAYLNRLFNTWNLNNLTFKEWIKKYIWSKILSDEERDFFMNLDIEWKNMKEIFSEWLDVIKQKYNWENIEPILEVIEVSSDWWSNDIWRLQNIVWMLRSLWVIVVAYWIWSDWKKVEEWYKNDFNPKEWWYYCNNLLLYPQAKAQMWSTILDKI